MDYPENKTPSEIHSAFQQAINHFQQREFAQAEKLAWRILEINPDHADANHLLGLLSGMKDKHDLAQQLIAHAIKCKPDNPTYYLNYGLALVKGNRLDEALAAYEKAIQFYPELPEAHNKRGNVLRNLGRLDEAKAAYERVIQLRPGYAEAHYNLGNVHYAQGNQDQAIRCYQQAISLKPDFAEAYCNLGNAFNERERPDNALAAYDRAIQLKPDYAEGHSNRGMVLMQLNRRAEALAAYDQALRIKPDFAVAHNNRGLVLIAMGRLQEAINSYDHALELMPDYVQAHDNLLFALNYDPVLSPEEIFKAHCDWDRRHARELFPGFSTGGGINNDKRHRLRIGYVSPDFRTHSVAYFIEPVIGAHHRDKVEIFCYYNASHPDSTTERIRSKADHWLSIINMTDESVAERIRQDRIDILVDLSGHTAYNRLLVFARKPAPLQLTWLGYPNTTGMKTMDYRLTDIVADPTGDADQLHTEELIRLEHGFLCYQPPESTKKISALPAIDTGYITFGSFNNLAKVNTEVIRVWSEILHAVPKSRLLMKDKAFQDEVTREKYLGQFATYRVAAERIDLYQMLPKTEDHLGLYNQVDIGLDTFPYNGTTTTCEALWMGVPVLTLTGNRHAGRVGASILEYSGHPEWIASSPASYVDLAVHLATDIDGLDAARRSLRAQVMNSALCNSDAFAHTIEKAYRDIWNTHVNK